jgi:hypothetical protein
MNQNELTFQFQNLIVDYISFKSLVKRIALEEILGYFYKLDFNCLEVKNEQYTEQHFGTAQPEQQFKSSV